MRRRRSPRPPSRRRARDRGVRSGSVAAGRVSRPSRRRPGPRPRPSRAARGRGPGGKRRRRHGRHDAAWAQRRIAGPRGARHSRVHASRVGVRVLGRAGSRPRRSAIRSPALGRSHALGGFAGAGGAVRTVRSRFELGSLLRGRHPSLRAYDLGTNRNTDLAKRATRPVGPGPPVRVRRRGSWSARRGTRRSTASSPGG